MFYKFPKDVFKNPVVWICMLKKLPFLCYTTAVIRRVLGLKPAFLNEFSAGHFGVKISQRREPPPLLPNI